MLGISQDQTSSILTAYFIFFEIKRMVQRFSLEYYPISKKKYKNMTKKDLCNGYFGIDNCFSFCLFVTIWFLQVGYFIVVNKIIISILIGIVFSMVPEYSNVAETGLIENIIVTTIKYAIYGIIFTMILGLAKQKYRNDDNFSKISAYRSRIGLVVFSNKSVSEKETSLKEMISQF